MKIKFYLLVAFIFSFFVEDLNAQTTTFNYTGSVQTYVVPAGVTSLNFEVIGAKGGGTNGGSGARVLKDCYPVTPGQILNIYVGGTGTQGANSGGWNGGGTGHTTATVAYRSWGGGGASDIRVGGTALANRVIVAGGGGGRSGGSGPVAGGAANCNNGAAGTSTFGTGGGGGTQTAGGAGGAPWAGTPPGGSPGTLGQGGQGGNWQTASGGGGGGGFYGGGGGGNDGCCTGANGGGGGGGGSSLVPAGGTCSPPFNTTGNGQVKITVSTLPGVTATNTGPYCPGQTIQLNATGGGTYAWTGPNGFSSSLQNPTISNMTAANAGTYTVTVTNGGCSAPATTTVTLNAGPTVNLTPTNTACAAATNGVINVVASNSSPGYNVAWTGPTSGNPSGVEISSNGGNFPIPNLGVGTYSVTVTANNSCSTTVSATIIANPGVTGSATFTSPQCSGADDGLITVTANQGIAPYQVSWTGPTSGNPAGDEITTPNGTFQIFSALAGDYSITITDAVGCFYTFQVTVTQPSVLNVSNFSALVSCNGGNNGSAEVTATGGTSGYNVSWTGTTSGDPSGIEITNDGGIYNMTGLIAGLYNVTVTDANNCTATTTVNIAEPVALTASNTSTDATCNAASNGLAVIAANGGTSGYNVSWTGTASGDPAGVEITNSGGTYDMVGLGAGTYNVTVTDVNNCSATTTVTIDEPTAITASNSSTEPLCNAASDGSAEITAGGGTAGYNVSWTGTASGDPAGIEITNSGGTYDMNNLAAGTYNVTVTDVNNCFTTTTVIINEPTVLTASNTPTDATCNAATNGLAVITVNGGTAGYNVSWSGTSSGDPAGLEITINGGTYDMNGLVAGTYNVTVTDANNCQATTTVTINEPSVLTASNVSVDVSCSGGNNGAAEITALGGTSGYNVSWTGISSGDPVGIEITNSGETYDISGLVAGTYNVTVTDANNCEATTIVTIIAPAGVTASNIATDATCNATTDGFAVVTASGGTEGYNVSWTGTSSGDPVGIEITNSGGTFDLIGLGTGTYNVTVTDANNCAATTTVIINEPAELTASNSPTDALCNAAADGQAVITASGGTPGYNVSWTGTASGNPFGIEITNNGGTYNMTGLIAGTYNVIVTDANNCEAVTTVTIAEPTVLTVTNIPTDASCNAATDGFAIITASGGTEGYDVSWAGTSSGDPVGIEIASSSGTYTIGALGAGTYNVTVTDDNNCITTTTVNIAEPSAIIVSTVPFPPVCNGGLDGSIAVSVSGGNASYDVSWSGPSSDDPIGYEVLNDGGSYTITGIGSGNYNIEITDISGCVLSASTLLTPPSSLTISSVVTDVSCNGASTGSIQVTANNGTPGYEVSWIGTSTGDPTGVEITSAGGSYSVDNLSFGNYIVYVTDVNGCYDSVITQLNEPQILEQINTITPTLCATSTDGAVNVTVTGGISPYNLSLNGTSLINPPGDEINSSGGSYSFSNLGVDTYVLTITDDNNCTVSSSIDVTSNNTSAMVSLSGTTICNGQSTTLTPTADPPGGTFLWGNGSSNSTLTVSPTTTTQYAVLYNYNGCLAQGLADVIVNPIPTVSVANATICLGQSATLTSSTESPAGGSYNWSTNGTQQAITVSPTSTTNYSLIYSANGCSSIPVNGTVTVNPIPQIVINSPSICEGEIASLTATPDLPGGSINWSPTNETSLSINVSPTTTTSYSAVYTVNGCSSTSTSSTVTVNPIPVVSFQVDNTEGCSPLSVNLSNTSVNAGQSTLTSWSIDGGISTTGDNFSTVLLTGCHDVTLSMTINGCTGLTTYNDLICVEDSPVASFVSNLNAFTEPEHSVNFSNQSLGANSYVWNMGDGNIYSSTDVTHDYSITSDGYTIWLYAYSALGCIDSTSLTIPFQETLIYYIPNSFTPDGDEFNNVFRPIFSKGIDINTFEMRIYNRWGEVLFESVDPSEGWNGSYGEEGLDIQAGTYAYIISFKTPQKDDRQLVTGHVNLIR